MSERPDNPGCGVGHDSASITVEDALARIREAIAPVTLVERVPVRDALGRVLAADIRTPHPVPGHDNSAMDGYAIRHADQARQPLREVGSAYAGHPFEGQLGEGECVRIMTGGVVPAGADSVVMQEVCRADGGRVHVDDWPDAGENVRRAGEDTAAGDRVVTAGTRLTAANLGVIAATGKPEIGVYRRLRAAFFSTGDELRSAGEPIETGQIYDSNRYTLHGMLARLGTEVIDMGVVRDDPAELRAALETAAASADVVLTSGGVSVGSADYVTDTLAEIGRIGFWTVSIKPGRPLAFGHIDRAAFFGLPGNPVSSMVTFAQIVAPSLRHMSGETGYRPVRFHARLVGKRLRKKPGRMEFQRGHLDWDTNGEPQVRGFGSQGSGILRSMSTADCFIVLPLDGGGVEPGEWVTVEPFTGPLGA